MLVKAAGKLHDAWCPSPFIHDNLLGVQRVDLDSSGNAELGHRYYGSEPGHRCSSSYISCPTGRESGAGGAIGRQDCCDSSGTDLYRNECDGCTLRRFGCGTSQVSDSLAPRESLKNAIRSLFATAHSIYGKIDVLVNNAGRIEPVARIADSDVAEWSHTVDINLKGERLFSVRLLNVIGVYYGMRYACDFMNAGSTIINISSGAATSALEGWSHYCATKAGVLALTKVSAVHMPIMITRLHVGWT